MYVEIILAGYTCIWRYYKQATFVLEGNTSKLHMYVEVILEGYTCIWR